MRHGLTPGHNVDKVDVAAGLRELKACGNTNPHTRMVIEYALQRHARGEEELAQRTAIAPDLHGVDLTTWFRVLAVARAAAATTAEDGHHDL
jgi:hypothetical protein